MTVAFIIIALLVVGLCIGGKGGHTRLTGEPDVPWTSEDQENLDRFIRAGGCPKCGTPPGMPCDMEMHQ